MEEEIKDVEMAVINLDRTNMSIVQPKQQKLIKKCFIFQCRFIYEFIRLAIYFSIAFGIFFIFIRKSELSFAEGYMYGSDNSIYTEKMRGIFPSVTGDIQDIDGKWKVVFTSSFEKQVNTKDFQKYTLQFKSHNRLRILHQKCQGNVIMNWKVYAYNIYISDYDSTNQDDQMIIKPKPQDIQCIHQTQIFFTNIRFSSIWSISDNRLYILIEKWNSSLQTNTLQVLILQK